MREEAQPDLGDSAIVEAYGLGGAIAHASPEIARSMGRDWREAQEAARVAASGRAVRIHTGIGHRDGETGWIGVGVAEAPLACFSAAMAAMGDEG